MEDLKIVIDDKQRFAGNDVRRLIEHVAKTARAGGKVVIERTAEASARVEQ